MNGCDDANTGNGDKVGMDIARTMVMKMPTTTMMVHVIVMILDVARTMVGK